MPIWQSLSFEANIFPLNELSPKFPAMIFFPFIDRKCNERKVNKDCFFSP